MVSIAACLAFGLLVAPAPASAGVASSDAVADAGLVRHRPVVASPVDRGRDQALRRPIVGVQFHGMWSDYTDSDRAAVLDRLRRMGARWVRLDLAWAMLQPSGPGAYDMRWGVPFADRVIAMAHRRGLKVLVMFWLTPGWANGYAGERTGPTDPRTYANAIRWASRRWAREVQGWEIWNEPNSGAFWTSEDPVSYTRLLCRAYHAVKRGNPRARVVFGGVQHNDVGWIRRAYDAGARGCFDLMATHPYVGPSDAHPSVAVRGEMWEFPHVAAVRRLMLNRRDRKPIWVTEFGWSTHRDTGREAPWERGVTPATQARFSVAALRILAKDHRYVRKAFFYNEREKATSNPHQNGFGLLRRDLAAKPAYLALRDYLS
jgi:hypothetical protein